jgi:acyl transferase domain-containing protein/predicted O-methyltransferase YrrM/aryl carrier-like protein
MSDFDIAVIGMAGRFPGAPDLETFWENLKNGVESISFFEPEESEGGGAAAKVETVVNAGGVIEGAELFDAEFFGYSPREAELMDPQQRLFLEYAWNALESAGYDPKGYPGAVGVYAGASINQYLFQLLTRRGESTDVDDFQLMLLNNRDFLTTRVSYRLNLKGPSINVQTACSTSLVAVHQACLSLLNYQCDAALAGGVSLRVPRRAGYVYREGMILAPDGHCRAFDAEGKGTVPGEGVGVVVLKRLEDALADRDNVRAVIKGGAVNNDGFLKVGFTAPSEEGQLEAIVSAHVIAGFDPATISYVEAHGTGTQLGDPIELAALRGAFASLGGRARSCAIGSVKTNIGHLDAAAGVAGLVKTVLALEHALLPPSLHFRRANPRLELGASPFYVNTELAEWGRGEGGGRRRAGVSSFGFGGTNAHLVLEEAPPLEVVAGGEARAWHVLPLSARSAAGLQQAAAQLADHLDRHPDIPLANVAYTLQAGRHSFEHRCAVVCRERDEAVRALRDERDARRLGGKAGQSETPVAFIIPGECSQYPGMTRRLYETEPTFREELDGCAELLRPRLGADLRELLYGEAGAGGRLGEVQFMQPALFSVSYSLAKLWMSWGVSPHALLGYGVGEYVAAALAGVFSLEDALGLVTQLGALLHAQPRGSMLRVEAAAEAIGPLLVEGAAISAVNAPESCVVSGTPESIEWLSRSLGARGVVNRALDSSHALYSKAAGPVLQAWAQIVRRTDRHSPSIPLVSKVAGEEAGEAEGAAEQYWMRHPVRPILFSEGLEKLEEMGRPVLLEVGPAGTLPDAARTRHAFNSLPLEASGEAEEQALAKAFAGLWVCGVKTEWAQYHADSSARRVPLPTYPFERQRYWLQPAKRADGAGDGVPAKTGEARRGSISDWFSVPSWKRGTPVGGSTELEDGRCWLVLCDTHGLGRALVERLRGAGQQAVAVEAGREFTVNDGDEYSITSPTDDEYQQLFVSLKATGKIPTEILYLSSVSGVLAEGESLPTAKGAGRAVYDSLLYLSQALCRQGVTSPVRITVICDGLFEVLGDDPVYPEKATLLGPCKVIPQEFGNLFCRCIDIGMSWGGADAGRLFQQLWEELTGGADDLIVALRHGRRWVQTFEPLRLEAGARGVGRLREKGVYLITGGTGGVGLLVAEHLARKARARLILVSRMGVRAGVERATTQAPSVGAAQSFDLARDDSFVEGLEREARGSFGGLRTEEYAALQEALGGLCGRYIYQYVGAAGLDRGKGRQVSAAQLRRDLGVNTRFERFYEFMLGVLAEDGIIERRDGVFTFLKGPDEVEPVPAQERELRERFPQFNSFYDLLGRCVSSYPQVLSGATTGVDVLFPGGETRLLEASLSDLAEMVESQVYKRVVAGLIARLVAERRPLRILEVGAGTGMLTKSLLPALHGGEVEYWFTDIGASFLVGAQGWLSQADRRRVRFGKLDVSREPAAQGFEPQSFDLVVGLDVVHATPDISETVGHLRSLLKPGGLLCLIEMVKRQRWIDMVWGLTDGWWLFDDFRRERNSALASIPEWESVLAGHEFGAFAVYPHAERERTGAEYGLVLAQAAGGSAAPPEADARTQPDAAGAADLTQAVRRLEQLGAEVFVSSADVSDPEQMAAVLEEAGRRFGPVNGVIHAAGIPGGAMVMGQTPRAAESVFRSKVDGTLVLHHLFEGQKLDFFLLWSSISSFTGGIGQIAYTAASAFLDAYAHSQRDGGRFTCSINWPLWNGVGTAVPVQQRHFELTGEEQRSDVITPEEALRAMARVLDAEGVAQVAVTPVDLGALVERFHHFRRDDAGGASSLEPAAGAGPRALHARPSLANAYVPPRDDVERRVAAVWSEALGIEQIGRDDNFFELGGDSLVAIKIISQIKRAENADLSVVAMFERPTVGKLAELIRGDEDEGGAFEEFEDLRQKRKAARVRKGKR